MKDYVFGKKTKTYKIDGKRIIGIVITIFKLYLLVYIYKYNLIKKII